MKRPAKRARLEDEQAEEKEETAEDEEGEEEDHEEAEDEEGEEDAEEGDDAKGTTQTPCSYEGGDGGTEEGKACSCRHRRRCEHTAPSAALAPDKAGWPDSGRPPCRVATKRRCLQDPICS